MKSEFLDRDGNRPEDTAAYQVLKKHNLLDTSYRLDSPGEIDGVEPNSNPWSVLMSTLFCCPCHVFQCFKSFTVPEGHVMPARAGAPRISLGVAPPSCMACRAPRTSTHGPRR